MPKKNPPTKPSAPVAVSWFTTGVNRMAIRPFPSRSEASPKMPVAVGKIGSSKSPARDARSAGPRPGSGAFRSM